MLPTVLRRGSWCYSYFIRLYRFHYWAYSVESWLILCARAFFQFLALCSSRLGTRADSCDSRVFVCLFCMHWFMSFVLFFFVFFFTLGVSGLAAACDCGTPWAFLLLTFLSAIIRSGIMIITFHCISLHNSIKLTADFETRFEIVWCWVTFCPSDIILKTNVPSNLFLIRKNYGSQNRRAGIGKVAW